jgi:hypothetical protein
VDIVLDTNIIIEDPHFSSPIYKALKDYLEKTGSQIIIPDIVFKELGPVYSRRLNTEKSKAHAQQNRLNNLLNKSFPLPEIDVESETKAFLYRIEKTFGKFAIKKLRTDSYEQAIDRLVNHIPPCSENREEFKDTLVWLDVLHYSKIAEGEIIGFISNNTKDFSSQQKDLRSDLENEAQRKGISVKYHKSISDFLKTHAEKIHSFTDEF